MTIDRTNTDFQVSREQTKDEREALATSLRKFGQLHPVAVTPDGRIIDGFNRYDILTELGLKPDFKVIEAQGEEEYFAMAIEMNAARRQLSRADKRDLAAKAIARWGDLMSDRKIAAMVGLSPATVGAIRKPKPAAKPKSPAPAPNPAEDYKSMYEDALAQLQDRPPVPENCGRCERYLDQLDKAQATVSRLEDSSPRRIVRR